MKKIETTQTYLDWIRSDTAVNLIQATMDITQLLWNGIRVKDLNNLLNFNWNAIKVETVKQGNNGMSIQELVIENVITHEEQRLQHITTHGHLDNLFRDAIEKFIKDEKAKIKRASKSIRQTLGDTQKTDFIEVPKADIPEAAPEEPKEAVEVQSAPESVPEEPIIEAEPEEVKEQQNPIKTLKQIQDFAKGKIPDVEMPESVARMAQFQGDPSYNSMREKCVLVVEAVLELSEINITKQSRAELALKGLDIIERILGIE